MDNRSAPRAIPAMVSLDGYELVPLEPSDAPQVLQLLELRGNRYLVELGASEHEVARLLAELAQAPWSLPLAVLRGDECVGMATTSLANLKSLNASLLALFTDPPGSSLALALYLRHVFWNFPLHRLHTQVPSLDLTREYEDLYRSVGFVDEGRLVGHVVIAGRPFDVTVLGLLRADFEAWCATHEPRLSL